MIRIAGVVVLYNPPEDVLQNINSYRGQIETLFIVDNSEKQNQTWINNIILAKNVIYKWNGGNLGVATALNIGAKLAIDHDYDFLLTMDQDSFTSENLLREYSQFIQTYSSNDIGILAPYHVYKNYERPAELAMAKEISMTITSGALLNLAAYKQAGPFMDDLFIDYVDFEYCLRLRISGFKVIQLSLATLNHQLGAIEARRFIFRRVAVYNYPPIRVYYKFRNRLFVVNKFFFAYPMWAFRELITSMNELIKIICFEKNKYIKCKMAFLGMRDCVIGRMGKYRHV
ncbi:MAG: hypothetical protein C0417_02550 [Chlorobiaceae bacterium]|nr:hypothetical protein [Chlorobiaceae bacterium]